MSCTNSGTEELVGRRSGLGGEAVVLFDRLALFALAQLGDYLEVFEGDGVAFDFAVGG